MNLFLPDTHAVYWYEFQNPKLSSSAHQTFKDAEAGNALLIVHPIVLAEFYWILKKAGLESKFPKYVQFVQSSAIYRYEPINLDDLNRLDEFHEIPEMHDRLIAILAQRLGATIITTDPDIQRSAKVKTLW